MTPWNLLNLFSGIYDYDVVSGRTFPDQWGGVFGTWPSEVGYQTFAIYQEAAILADIRTYICVIAWIACMFVGFKLWDWFKIGSPLSMESRGE